VAARRAEAEVERLRALSGSVGEAAGASGAAGRRRKMTTTAEATATKRKGGGVAADGTTVASVGEEDPLGQTTGSDVDASTAATEAATAAEAEGEEARRQQIIAGKVTPIYAWECGWEGHSDQAQGEQPRFPFSIDRRMNRPASAASQRVAGESSAGERFLHKRNNRSVVKRNNRSVVYSVIESSS
jgi:hypothetical protein